VRPAQHGPKRGRNGNHEDESITPLQPLTRPLCRSGIPNFLLARDDVDASKLALYGVSQAGYWVARTLAFENRFAAAIADGGVVNVGNTWFSHLPPQLLDLYRSGDKATFDQYMRQAMAAPGAEAERENWTFRARPYGVAGYSAVLDEVAKYDVTDVAGQITTPLYITDSDGEQFSAVSPPSSPRSCPARRSRASRRRKARATTASRWRASSPSSACSTGSTSTSPDAAASPQARTGSGDAHASEAERSPTEIQAASWPPTPARAPRPAPPAAAVSARLGSGITRNDSHCQSAAGGGLPFTQFGH